MRTIPRDHIVEAVIRAGMFEGDVQENYSGRAMYGQACFGLSCDDTRQLAGFFIELVGSQERYDLAVHLATAMRSDNLGRGMIYYFPGYLLGD